MLVYSSNYNNITSSLNYNNFFINKASSKVIIINRNSIDNINIIYSIISINSVNNISSVNSIEYIEYIKYIK